MILNSFFHYFLWRGQNSHPVYNSFSVAGRNESFHPPSIRCAPQGDRLEELANRIREYSEQNYSDKNCPDTRTWFEMNVMNGKLDEWMSTKYQQ